MIRHEYEISKVKLERRYNAYPCRLLIYMRAVFNQVLKEISQVVWFWFCYRLT